MAPAPVIMALLMLLMLLMLLGYYKELASVDSI
jgi:hypothetical protein